MNSVFRSGPSGRDSTNRALERPMPLPCEDAPCRPSPPRGCEQAGGHTSAPPIPCVTPMMTTEDPPCKKARLQRRPEGAFFRPGSANDSRRSASLARTCMHVPVQLLTQARFLQDFCYLSAATFTGGLQAASSPGLGGTCIAPPCDRAGAAARRACKPALALATCARRVPKIANKEYDFAERQCNDVDAPAPTAISCQRIFLPQESFNNLRLNHFELRICKFNVAD